MVPVCSRSSDDFLYAGEPGAKAAKEYRIYIEKEIRGFFYSGKTIRRKDYIL